MTYTGLFRYSSPVCNMPPYTVKDQWPFRLLYTHIFTSLHYFPDRSKIDDTLNRISLLFTLYFYKHFIQFFVLSNHWEWCMLLLKLFISSFCSSLHLEGVFVMGYLMRYRGYFGVNCLINLFKMVLILWVCNLYVNNVIYCSLFWWWCKTNFEKN